MLWELQLIWRQYSKKRQLSPSDYWSNQTGPWSAAPLSVQSSYRYEDILRIGEVMGHRIDAKISPKAASEKAQTTVSENRYTSPRIDVFGWPFLMLFSANKKQWVCVIFGTPGTWYLCYSLAVSPNVYAVFLHFWVSEYTCPPIIANLLYHTTTTN